MKCKSDSLSPKAVVLANVFVVFTRSETHTYCLLYRLADFSSQKGWCFLFSRPLNTWKAFACLLTLHHYASRVLYIPSFEITVLSFYPLSVFFQQSPFYYIVGYIFLGFETKFNYFFRRGCFSEWKADCREGKEEISVVCCELLVASSL